jgi:hypothetical protein
MKLCHLGTAIVAAAALQAVSVLAAETILDYTFFKARVEPVFLEKRAGHVRCYVCHSESNNAFKLQHLSTGNKSWTDEQSRKNFESASHLVVPGEPLKSLLLLQPLAPEAGGNPYHSGGRQFENKNVLEWKTLAEWVNGKKAPAR